MKASVYEVRGCMGSQSYKEVAQFDTMKEAIADEIERNEERAGMEGKSLREFMAELNHEGHFFAGKRGLDGWRLQR